MTGAPTRVRRRRRRPTPTAASAYPRRFPPSRWCWWRSARHDRHRERTQPAQDGGRAAVRWTGGADPPGPAEEGLEGDPSLHPGQRRADAVVDTRTEPEVVVRISLEAELVRLVEVAGIAIGGSNERQDL